MQSRSPAMALAVPDDTNRLTPSNKLNKRENKRNLFLAYNRKMIVFLGKA
jgi:hypothetical protein